MLDSFNPYSTTPRLVLAGLVVLLAGCQDLAGGGSSSCELNSDCPLPEVCIDERCVVQCRVDSDCAENEQCQGSICIDPLAGCLNDGDCAEFGLVCDVARRRCVDSLAGDMTVPVRDGAPPADRGQPPPPRDTGIPILDQEVPPPPPDMDEPPPPQDMDVPPPPQDMDMPPPPPDMAMPMRGDAQYGDPCRCGADCASGFCLQNPYNDFAGQCSAQCGANAAVRDCPGIDRCVQARVPGLAPGCPDPGLGLNEGELVEICAPNETGIPCRGAADCIIDGTCVTPPDPLASGAVAIQSVCGARCQDDQGCPIGFRCQQVGMQGGQPVQVCAAAVDVAACPDGSNQTCGGVCPLGPGDDPLDVSYCLLLDNGPGGMCSCSCRNAGDCPTGFACSRNVLDTGNPNRPGICLPISGYTCPMGDGACLSTLCAPPQGNDTLDRCTAPCNGPQDCPVGYSCLQPPGAQITVCVVN